MYVGRNIAAYGPRLDSVDCKFNSDFSLKANWKINLPTSCFLIESITMTKVDSGKKMNEFTHDPREHIRGIHQIFISDKKRIAFLFGAGTSFGTGLPSVQIPAIAKMTDLIVEELGKISPKIKKALQEIKKEIEKKTEIEGNQFNVESLLSSIETKKEVIGAGTLNGLNAAEFADLVTAVKNQVLSLVSIHKTLPEADIPKLAHSKVASWISKARRVFPAEIYTTNYDYLFEIALEHFGIAYFDGFSGSYEPFFCSEAVEDLEAYKQLVKLWKLHGSLGWRRREKDGAVIKDKTAKAEDLMIFPSYLKYSNSKKQPYVGLIDRLCTFLQQDDAVLITCGYSFSDRHINERIATSLRRGGNSHVIAMYYDEFSDAKAKVRYGLADPTNNVRKMATHETSGKMSVYGIRHAVIGGRFGEWKLRGEPRSDEAIKVSQYFDEDASIPSAVVGEHKGDEKWEGTGKFVLSDFLRLAEFLDSMTPDIDFDKTVSHEP
jgi:SIR2-like domain